MLKTDEFIDYYARLGLKKGCEEREIKLAYRKLAKGCHPDLHREAHAARRAEEEFKKLSEAYSVLSKSSSRIDYDLTYSRHEAMLSARKDEEIRVMRRAMSVYGRKSSESAARRERRDPNRPARRRPLLLRRETPPPAWFGWFFVLFWILGLVGFLYSVISSWIN